ncbi:MAG: translation initiation factor 6 [Archaeoglobi archaeon]|nr:translation initiation factor 6 [Archaeoglobi archaeon]
MEMLLSYEGVPEIGIFIRVTEDYAFVPPNLKEEKVEEIERALDVHAIKTTVNGLPLLGCLITGNSNGIIVSPHIMEDELKRIEKEVHIPVERLKSRHSAVGNIILANDSGALVYEELERDAAEQIKKVLGVPVQRGRVDGVSLVGMAAVVTNKGILAHPKTSEKDLVMLEELFSVTGDIGTVNMGSPMVGMGLSANSKGYIAGEDTTPIEIGRIEDALGFLEG